jgi:hypothetical protein
VCCSKVKVSASSGTGRLISEQVSLARGARFP